MSSSHSLKLDWCSAKAARFACENWHYSGTMPVGKTVKVGAWENGEFVGVVVFSPGCGKACDGRRYGLAQTLEVAELQRVALRAHKTEVSRIIAIAIRMLRKQSPGIRMLVSFADPSQGHTGGIYKAGGWVYTGKSTNATFYEMVGGRVVHPRTVTSGFGAGTSGMSKHKLTGRKVEVPGKHRYVLGLDDEMKQRLRALTKPYPKRAGSDTGDTPGHHPGEGGSIPTPALS